MDNYLYVWRIPFLEIIIWVSLYYHSLIAMGFMSVNSAKHALKPFGEMHLY